MESFSNENIIKLIFKNYILRETTTFFNKINSSILSLIIQQIINYKYIFTSKRKHFSFPDSDYRRIVNLHGVTEGQVLEISPTSTNLWDVNSSQCISMTTNNAPSSAILPNCQLVTYAGQIQFWQNDYKSTEKIITLEGLSGKKVFSLAGGKLACVVIKEYREKTLIIDYQTSKIIKTLNIKSGTNSIISISNEKLATCSQSGALTFWDTKDYHCLAIFQAEEFSSIEALLFVEKRNLMISGASSLKIWDVSFLPQRIRIIKDVGIVLCLLLLPGGYFASGSRYGHIKIWSLDTFHCVNTFRQPEGDVKMITLLKDYRIISSSDSKIVIWDY
jgi:WD40 repeat protein